MVALRFPFAAALVAVALPVAAQNVVVVPLDPVDPNEVVDPGAEPGTVLPPANAEDQGGLVPLDPMAPGEVMPGIDGTQLDPNAPLRATVGQDVTTVQEVPVKRGTGAVLKGLDKLDNTVTDMHLAQGDTVGLGWLQITLGECRYPEDNPSGDAFAWLVIREEAGAAPVFEGWMVASSPALNALDNARYDVWVSHCTVE